MSLEHIMEEQKRRMSIYGSTHEQTLDSTIFYDFESNPAYRVVEFNGEKIGVHWIEGATKDRENTMNNFLISKPPHKFELGNIVKDEYGVFWVVLIENNFQYNKVFVEPCNHEFIWQNKETFEIKKYPCILTDKTSVYSDGLSKTRLIVTGTNQVMVMMPHNDYTDTSNFNFGDRFIFLNSKEYIFELVRIDALTTKGFIKLTMRRDEHDSLRDRLDLNIADYIDPDEAKPDRDVPSNEIHIIGDNEMSVWGGNKLYTVNTDKPVKWSVVSGNTLRIIDFNEEQCEITYQSKNNLGQGTLRATLVEDDSKFIDKTIMVVF